MKEFHRLLQKASASQPLVLFLDSLDQLHSYNIRRELSWLPSKLPAHVKIVLTCLTGDQAFSSLKVGTLYNRMKSNFLSSQKGEQWRISEVELDETGLGDKTDTQLG